MPWTRLPQPTSSSRSPAGGGGMLDDRRRQTAAPAPHHLIVAVGIARVEYRRHGSDFPHCRSSESAGGNRSPSKGLLHSRMSCSTVFSSGAASALASRSSRCRNPAAPARRGHLWAGAGLAPPDRSAIDDVRLPRRLLHSWDASVACLVAVAAVIVLGGCATAPPPDHLRPQTTPGPRRRTGPSRRSRLRSVTRVNRTLRASGSWSATRTVSVGALPSWIPPAPRSTCSTTSGPPTRVGSC